MPYRYESDTTDISPLGVPLRFHFADRTAKNRFLKAAMTERLSSWDPKDLPVRGIPSTNLINVYKRWGEGGFGMILTGNIMTTLDHLEAAGNAIIPLESGFGDARFEAFKKLGVEAKRHGSLIVGQISHPGRQVPEVIQRNPLSASDVQHFAEAMGMKFAKPRPATKDDIIFIVEQFTHAAEYLYKAGWDGIQLHGAHGYLLAQFLSQTTNKRTDEYGGSLENRARIITEIADSIRQRIPVSTGFMLGIKINSVEFQQSLFTSQEARILCALLETHGFDFVELSGGTYESMEFRHRRESTIKREGFFLEFADEITPNLKKTRSYVTGGFKSVGAMGKALQSVDGVGLGRPICQEFNLPQAILDSKVTGAIRPLIDEEDFMSTTMAAGAQIRQVGNDQQPFDLSKQSDVDGFMRDLGKWFQKMKEDGDKMSEYGYAEIETVKAVPYGAPQVMP